MQSLLLLLDVLYLQILRNARPLMISLSTPLKEGLLRFRIFLLMSYYKKESCSFLRSTLLTVHPGTYCLDLYLSSAVMSVKVRLIQDLTMAGYLRLSLSYPILFLCYLHFKKYPPFANTAASYVVCPELRLIAVG